MQSGLGARCSTRLLSSLFAKGALSVMLNEFATAEPQFNDEPRDWGNLFVISGVRYTENLDLRNLR